MAPFFIRGTRVWFCAGDLKALFYQGPFFKRKPSKLQLTCKFWICFVVDWDGVKIKVVLGLILRRYAGSSDGESENLWLSVFLYLNCSFGLI